jgi:hypothetical protein
MSVQKRVIEEAIRRHFLNPLRCLPLNHFRRFTDNFFLLPSLSPVSSPSHPLLIPQSNLIVAVQRHTANVDIRSVSSTIGTVVLSLNFLVGKWRLKMF